MTTAVVLIESERDAMSSLGGALADLDGVAEAYSVTGEWDFVAIVRVPRHEMLAEVVTGELVKRRGRLDVALMCIGGNFTMDRFDAVAAAELVGADQVIPCHYNTFPAVETDVQAFKSDVQNAGFAEVIVLEPGAAHPVR